MQKISPFLMFNNNLGDAAAIYPVAFSDSKVNGLSKAGNTAMSATFSIFGKEILSFNGGDYFQFTPAISFFVDCKTEAEVDKAWKKLSDGGEKQRCGWVKDRFGVSWQIIPPILGEYLQDQDRQKANRVMEAMMQMDKIEIKKLKEAYEGN
ncbi:VOC family protein [Leptospira kmetyi]|uniref:VOC family protein n=1 Tax=Leptospira kmetyi TaxID=408139 RepID=UPI003EBE00D5